MSKMRIVSLGLGSFARVWTLFAMICGFVFGVFTLVATLLGGSATSDVFVAEFTGVTAGLVNLVWAPILFGMIALATAIFLYLPFTWAMRLSGGLSVQVMQQPHVSDASLGPEDVNDS